MGEDPPFPSSGWKHTETRLYQRAEVTTGAREHDKGAACPLYAPLGWIRLGDEVLPPRGKMQPMLLLSMWSCYSSQP